MKTANDILNDIKAGKPYTYCANLTKGRKFTIYINRRGHLFLSCNQLKGHGILTEKDAIEIINNDLNP